jgi:hypothetical protein
MYTQTEKLKDVLFQKADMIQDVDYEYTSGDYQVDDEVKLIGEKWHFQCGERDVHVVREVYGPTGGYEASQYLFSGLAKEAYDYCVESKLV